jgi:hypothetical protein
MSLKNEHFYRKAEQEVPEEIRPQNLLRLAQNIKPI